GLNMGQTLAQDGLNDLDLDALKLGMQDALGGKQPRLEDKDIIAAFGDLQARLEEKASEADEANQQAAADYLAENAKREGVTTTDCGLQHASIHPCWADGAHPAADDVVS